MFFSYPAVFIKTENFFKIKFIDFPKIEIASTSSIDAISLATKALENHIIYLIISKEEIPQASCIENIKFNDEDVPIFISGDIPEISNNYVKKTLTIPEWVNEMAINKQLNFSQILTEALLAKLGILQLPEKNPKK
ncbi:MAG: type II toxin-antitoxin system HicB family antitoxin [Clostridiales bacterium]|nr:type II toxin-antitoxin system HicB family antitoxin [Clostridiales bacterium]